MKALKIHFFGKNNLGGILIKARLSSIFSHCAVEFEDGRVADCRIASGVCWTTMDKIEPSKHCTTVNVEDDRYMEAYEYACSRIGKKYDLPAVVGFTLVTNWQSDDRDFCSEISKEIFVRATGIDLKTYSLITPGQLRLVADTYNATKAMYQKEKES